MHRLRQLRAYLEAFGLQGFSIWVSRQTAKIAKIRVPGLQHPVQLRRNSSDWLVFDDLFLKEFYALPEIPTPQFIVDAGANVGLVSAMWASRFPDTKIVAIEPNEENFSLLQKNTASYPKVLLLKAAVWPRTEKLAIRNPGSDSWAFEIEQSTVGNITAVTLMDILRLSGEARIDILKIDIEGAEKEVFEAEDAKEWLGLTGVLFVETHDRMKSGCSRAIFSQVIAFEFEQWIIGDTLRFDFRHSTAKG